ncbi:transposase [Streptomyces sp. NPDC048718]|uniref:transposase n=1 Tax=Streptomyces sp. NPDC048718 TaxID=3365587 RepID=UPI0037196608
MDYDLWALIEPLLPPRPERSPGPRPAPDRLRLQGILYVLHNDIAWQLLPLELGFGSGQTCWRPLERWQKAGVFDQPHRILLAELSAALSTARSARTKKVVLRARIPQSITGLSRVLLYGRRSHPASTKGA